MAASPRPSSALCFRDSMSGSPIATTFIETDSPGAGGLSGGALVSDHGEVVGVLQFSGSTAALGRRHRMSWAA